MVEVKINIPSLLSPLALEAIKTKLSDNIQLWKSVQEEATTLELKSAILKEIKSLQFQMDHFVNGKTMEVKHG